MKKLTGRQKAAILLISLGPELSAQIFKHLEEEEIEQLTLEIANIRRIPPEKRDEVYQEFYQMCLANEYISQGGIEYARELLEKALGSDKATEIIGRLTASLQVRPFDFIRKTDPAQLLNFIQGEHPQTIALIMAYLEPEQAAAVLSSLPAERQAEVARRIALMDRTSPEILRDVEKVLQRKLSSIVTQDYTSAGGVKSLVDVLNRVDRATEKTIMEALEVQDPELADEVKKLMFVFEDIVQLDDRAVQLILREVETHDLALALKGAGEEVMSKIERNISKRAAQMLKEDIEYMGPVRLRDVEEAQQKIVAIIRRLEEQGQIIITRGGGTKSLSKVIKAKELVISLPRLVGNQIEDMRELDIETQKQGENSDVSDRDVLNVKEAEQLIEETEIMVQQLLNEAREKAEKIVAEAEIRAQEILEKSRVEIEKIKQEMEKVGYEEGFALGQKALAAEWEKFYEEVAATKAEIETERKNVIRNMESEIVRLALYIARKVLQTELRLHPEQITAVVQATLAEALDTGDVVLRINSQDYDTVVNFIERSDHSRSSVRIEVDNSIQNGCVADTPYGIVDGVVENQLKEIEHRLLEVSQSV